MGNNKTKISRQFFSVDFAPVAKQRHARVQKVHFFWPVVFKTRQKRLVLKLKILIHAKWLNLRFFHLLVGKGGRAGN
jgi:predicted nuclease of restriction endonuclease-like (RecB) superfamily